MKNKRFIINALLLITISISFAAANVFAQTDGEILAPGNPPLTRNDGDEIIKYYERGLAIEFSAAQREEFQTKLVSQWRRAQKAGGAKNLEKFLQTVRTINGWSAAKREKLKNEIREAVLGDLRSSASSELNQFVLSVYENYGGENPTTAQTDETQRDASDEPETKTEARSETTDNFRPIEGAVKIADLVGKWNKGSVASYGYRNSTTNDYKSGYGAANQHDIYANGSFDYTNFAQVSLYNCTTELFTSMKGRVAVRGSEVTFTYVSGTVKGKDSCKTEGFTKPAQIRTTTYRLERDKNHIRLCEVGAQQPYCLYKVEE